MGGAGKILKDLRNFSERISQSGILTTAASFFGGGEEVAGEEKFADFVPVDFSEPGAEGYPGARAGAASSALASAGRDDRFVGRCVRSAPEPAILGLSRRRRLVFIGLRRGLLFLLLFLLQRFLLVG